MSVVGSWLNTVMTLDKRHSVTRRYHCSGAGCGVRARMTRDVPTCRDAIVLNSRPDTQWAQ